MLLHAPAKDRDYRKHLYEAPTLCHRTGWIALAQGRVTCSACLRKLERKPAMAARRRRRIAPGRVARYRVSLRDAHGP